MAAPAYVSWDMLVDSNNGNNMFGNGKSSKQPTSQTPELALGPSFVPSTPQYTSSLTPLAQGLSQVHFGSAASNRLTPLASPALPPTPINTLVNMTGQTGGSSAPEFMMAPGRDMAAMQFSSAAYGVPSFEGNGGFASFSMSNLHNAQASNMLGIAPVTTFMGMLQDQALYAHTMAGLLHETNEQIERLQRDQESTLQHKSSAHNSTQSSPKASFSSDMLDADASGRRRGRLSRQQENANDAKATNGAARATDWVLYQSYTEHARLSLDGSASSRLQSGPSVPIAKRSQPPSRDPPSGKLSPIEPDADHSSMPMISRSISTPNALNPQLTPLQHPFFTPIMNPSPALAPTVLTILPPAISLDDMKSDAPPTPQIRPKLPESVPAPPLDVKSNYQAMLEGQGKALGFSNELVKMVEDKRNTHKNSEKRRRDELKNGFLELRALIPGATTEKEMEDGTYSKATILRQAISYVSYVNKERENMKATIKQLQEANERLRSLSASSQGEEGEGKASPR